MRNKRVPSPLGEMAIVVVAAGEGLVIPVGCDLWELALVGSQREVAPKL